MLTLTHNQHEAAMEKQSQLHDGEFYEAMPEHVYRPAWKSFRKGEACHIAEAIADAVWDAVAAKIGSGDDKLACVDKLPEVLAGIAEKIGKQFVEKFQGVAANEMRERYEASGELLECVREEFMGVED